MSSSNLTLKCKCGSFEATFDSPPRLTFNCQCHSCVTAIKTIEAKESFNGTSMKFTPDAEYSGAAIAIYKSNNVTIQKVDKDKIGFLKVGEQGKGPRVYCTECGTVVFNVFIKNWCAANRNAMTNADGTPFEYDPKQYYGNVNCKHSFDKEKVPEPKTESVTFGMLRKFVPLIAGVFCDGSNAKEKALIVEDLSKVEFAPITWE